MIASCCDGCGTQYLLDAESAEPTCPRCAQPLRTISRKEILDRLRQFRAGFALAPRPARVVK